MRLCGTVGTLEYNLGELRATQAGLSAGLEAAERRTRPRLQNAREELVKSIPAICAQITVDEP